MRFVYTFSSIRQVYARTLSFADVIDIVSMVEGAGGRGINRPCDRLLVLKLPAFSVSVRSTTKFCLFKQSFLPLFRCGKLSGPVKSKCGNILDSHYITLAFSSDTSATTKAHLTCYYLVSATESSRRKTTKRRKTPSEP